MNFTKDVTIVIPARYSSRRFPKKPLVRINDKSMIETVYLKALKIFCKEVIILTDHKKILKHCLKFTNNVFMTSNSINSGTDRICSFVDKIKTKWILNIQGDEPFFYVPDIKLLLKKSFNSKYNFVASTLYYKKKLASDKNNSNECKVVTNSIDEVLYFSRSLIPHYRISKNCFYKKHIGVYLYKKNFLKKYSNLKFNNLEKIENLEQLRILENGYNMLAFEAQKETKGIDVRSDLRDKVIIFEN